MKKIALGLLMMLCSLSGWTATGCVVLSKGEAKVLVQKEEKSPPLRLSDCQGMKVVSGIVSACFMNDQNERTCRTLRSNDEFDPSLLSASKDADTGAFRATLVSLLKGDAQAKIGQTRGKRLSEFPGENLLLASGDLVIKLDSEATKKIKSLQINVAANGYETIVVHRKDDRLTVPATSLLRGALHNWEAKGEDVAFAGTFLFASQDRAEQMKQKSEELNNDPALDAMDRRVLIAEIYFENGFFFDAMSALNQIMP